MKKGKELTRAELEIMQILWDKSNVFLSDIVGSIPEPRPAYTTVSTVVRVLVRKGFVSYKLYSKANCYFPTITREEYASEVMARVKKNFFGGSASNMISFFAKEETLTEKEKAELLELLEE